jgi:hypothetical protein
VRVRVTVRVRVSISKAEQTLILYYTSTVLAPIDD